MLTRLGSLALAAVLAGGCRTYPKAPREGSNPEQAATPAKVDEAAALAAAMRQATSAVVDYKISPADLVSVTVYGNQPLDRKARVNANGMIFLPLVGGVKVGGKTLAAAQALIEEKMAAYVIRPQVSLFIDEYGNKTIFVMGEVQKPGSYPIPTESRMTVLEAISTAGGFTPVAAQDRARLLRYVNGESRSFTIDVKRITRDGHKEQDLVLEPNDVVYVPQSLF
jgi:polysaccharide export outer membrane protein